MSSNVPKPPPSAPPPPQPTDPAIIEARRRARFGRSQGRIQTLYAGAGGIQVPSPMISQHSLLGGGSMTGSTIGG